MTDQGTTEFLRGMALVLADLVRIGHVRLAREIIEPYDLYYTDFAGVADAADLAELRDVLPAYDVAWQPHGR